MRRVLVASVATVLLAAACGSPAPPSARETAGAGLGTPPAPTDMPVASHRRDPRRDPGAVPERAPATEPPAAGSAPPSTAPPPSPTAAPASPAGRPSASPDPTPTRTLAPVRGAWARLGNLPSMPDTLFEAVHAVALADGRVVAVQDDVCGGWSMLHGPADDPLPAAILDPVTGHWTRGSALNAFRSEFAAVGLADGRVLVTGGADGWSQSYSSTKLFDPATRRWANGGLLDTARISPGAAVLDDGRVLVAGGTYWLGFAHEGDVLKEVERPAPVALASAELYDPGTHTWSRAADLLEPIGAADAWTLRDGRVLLVAADGGPGSSVAEIYDPATDTWSRAGRIDRPDGSATALLADGSLLVVGGAPEDAGWRPIARAQRLDPGTGRVTDVASMPVPRTEAAAVTLADGRVLVVGGTDGRSPGPNMGGAPLATAVIYDPVRDAWAATASMPFADYPASAVLLPDGSVVVAGGAIPFDEPVTDVCGKPAVGWTARFTLDATAP